MHGYGFETGTLCSKCFKELDKIISSRKSDRLQCKKYMEIDLRRFIDTPKGEKFELVEIDPDDEPVDIYNLFNITKVEILDESEEETSFDIKMREIDEKFEARYRTFHENPEFVAIFRTKLSQCSDEVLISLLRAGEAHALQHKVEDDCDDCQNEDDDIELSHHTRGLGKLWLEVVKDLSLQVPEKPE